MSHVQLEADPDLRGWECGSRTLTGSEKPRDEARVMPRGGCWLCPRDLTGGVYLGAFPSLWPPALEVQKPNFADTPGRDPSVRRTLLLTQIMRPKYEPH